MTKIIRLALLAKLAWLLVAACASAQITTQPDPLAPLANLPNKTPPVERLGERIAVHNHDGGHTQSPFIVTKLNRLAGITLYAPNPQKPDTPTLRQLNAPTGLLTLEGAYYWSLNQPNLPPWIPSGDRGKLIISQCSQDAPGSHLPLTAQSPLEIGQIQADAADPWTPILSVVPAVAVGTIKAPTGFLTPAPSSLTTWGNSGSPWPYVYLAEIGSAAMQESAWGVHKADGTLVKLLCEAIDDACKAEGVPQVNGYLPDVRGNDALTFRIAVRVAKTMNAIGPTAFEVWWTSTGKTLGPPQDVAKRIWDAAQGAK